MMPDCSNDLNLNGLYIGEEDINQVCDSNSGKKDKSRNKYWGLRKFSELVCSKVKAKGRTTYNEVADEIIQEVLSTAEEPEQFEEKNIRRRVYDAFNVLIAINVIVKDKKAIKWIGFPSTTSEDFMQLKEERSNLLRKVQQKANYVKELEDKFVDLHNLLSRNQQLIKSAGITTEGIKLPFLLVKTNPKATVEIDISEDMRFVNFDFNETPFSLHDTDAILKAMRCSRTTENDRGNQTSSGQPSFITDQSRPSLVPASF